MKTVTFLQTEISLTQIKSLSLRNYQKILLPLVFYFLIITSSEWARLKNKTCLSWVDMTLIFNNHLSF